MASEGSWIADHTSWDDWISREKSHFYLKVFDIISPSDFLFAETVSKFLSSFELDLALLDFILEFFLLFLAFYKLLLQQLYFTIDFLELSFFFTEISHLFLHSFSQNGELSTEGFCLCVDYVVLEHAFNPHLKILCCKGGFGNLVVVKLRSSNDSCL